MNQNDDDEDQVGEWMQTVETIGWCVLGALLCILLSVMTGCSTIQPPPSSPYPNPNAVYKKELNVEINGKAYQGVGVVPKSVNSYSMKITSKVDVDLFSVTSCHRDFETQNAISVDWLHPKRSYLYEYSPVKGIEDSGYCMVRVAAFNKDKGASAFAVFDFEEDGMPAHIGCNGEQKDSSGVSVCQSKVGLIQYIRFDSPVDFSNKDPKCAGVKISTKDQMNFEYEIPKGECVWAFIERGGSRRIHRHTIFGFTDYIIEGGK